MNNPTIVRVPKESVSDDSYLVAHLFFREAEKVLKGQVFANLETSKSVVEVESPCDGYLFLAANEGEQIAVGAILAAVSQGNTRPKDIPALGILDERNGESPGKSQISADAARLIREKQLDISVFSHLPFVRAKDVEQFLGGRAVEAVITLNLPAIEKNHILIWGGGGHAKVCIEIMRSVGEFLPYGIIDKKMAIGETVLGVPVVGNEPAMEKFYEMGLRKAVLGIGAIARHAGRASLFRRLRDLGFELPNLVHPSAVVERSVIIGSGNQIFANATIGTDVKIGDGCIINSGAVVSHDCIIGNNVHLAPGALLAGMVNVGENTIVGMGASIFLGLKIGRDVTIKNGTAVNSDIPEGSIIPRTRDLGLGPSPI